jgi:excisionase family DNA binding protein
MIEFDQNGLEYSMPEEEYLTTAEVAKLLRVSDKTVHRLIESAQLSAVRIGKRWRISKTDLQEYLSRQRNQPPPS